ncbi:MFS transporter [Lysinibacter sp. HNR]|uniref:MFS transporter n=1 Tax=Lysinibacter sp. HNR TaxID=3031408 RepID=UPI002434ECE9|nr:MFS transporter [Lysinibacter sp. HNR]WGD37437.1 MFS transporter [Lysinibacter sp. HNR]
MSTAVDTNPSSPSPATPSQSTRVNKPWKVASATLIGTSVEWYDYGIYGFAAAVVFPTVFFPTLDAPVAILASFATLAVGSLGRPIGAAIFGHIGDRHGRKKSLFISLMLMGLMTVTIGLLPGYAVIGAAAPMILLLIRIMQSLAVGGEWGGALLFAVESAPRRWRALFGSFTQMGSGLGFFMSSGAFSLIALLGDEAVLEWAWRLPFLASAVLILTGLYIRYQLEETTEYQAVQRETEKKARVANLPLFEVLRSSWDVLLLAIGGFLVTIAGFYIIVNFISAYSADQLQLSAGDIANAGMVASTVSIVFTPIVAIVADMYGVRRITILGLALHLAVAWPMFMLLDLGTSWGLFAAMSLGMFVSTIAYAPIGTLVSGWFPAEVRQTGLSLAYQISGVIGGGLTPMVAQFLSIQDGGGWSTVALFFAGMGAVSLLCVLFKRGPGYLSFGDKATAGAQERSL